MNYIYESVWDKNFGEEETKYLMQFDLKLLISGIKSSADIKSWYADRKRNRYFIPLGGNGSLSSDVPPNYDVLIIEDSPIFLENRARYSGSSKEGVSALVLLNLLSCLQLYLTTKIKKIKYMNIL